MENNKINLLIRIMEKSMMIIDWIVMILLLIISLPVIIIYVLIKRIIYLIKSFKEEQIKGEFNGE